MKVWVPDYSNAGSTNLWGSSTTTTITDTGFVACTINGFGVNTTSNINIQANGLIVARGTGEARNPNNAVQTFAYAVIPVSSGDIISCNFGGASVNCKTCYFIPGKWV